MMILLLILLTTVDTVENYKDQFVHLHISTQ